LAIQHSAIPDNQRHEPKGISTASAGQVYLADGATSGVWRKVRESDLDFTNAANNKFGWNYRVDSQYTSGAPLAITSATKTVITNNGLGALTNTTRPLGITYAADSFTPSALNASYVLRVNAKVVAAATAGTPYVCKISLEGGAAPLQFAAQDLFIKGGSYVNDLSATFLFFTGSLNTNQPIKIYFTPDTNTTVHNISWLIQRTYVET
jgi:hypothetical protein